MTIFTDILAILMTLQSFLGLAPMPEPTNLGATYIRSIQLAASPGAGECLTTDGTDNDWASCGGGGLSGGTAGMLASWVNSTTLTATSTPTAGFFVATATRASVFPYASTTAVSASNLNITNALTFDGVTGTTWPDFCTTITGGAGLCDGSDDGGGGGSGAATTSFAATYPIILTSSASAITFSSAVSTTTVQVCASGCSFTSINAATALGFRSVSVAPGTYALSAPILLYPDLVIYGNGSLHQFNRSTVRIGMISADLSTDADNIKIYDLSLQATGASVGGTCLDFTNVVKSHFDALNCYTAANGFIASTTASGYYNSFTNYDISIDGGYGAATSSVGFGFMDSSSIHTTIGPGRVRPISTMSSSTCYYIDSHDITLQKANCETDALYGMYVSKFGSRLNANVYLEGNQTNLWFDASASGVGGYNITGNIADADTDAKNIVNNGAVGLRVDATVQYSGGDNYLMADFGIGTTTVSGGVELAIQGNMFIAGNITSTSTLASVFPYASTTALSALSASTTAFFSQGLGCASGYYVTWTAGQFGCALDQSGGAGTPEFTVTTLNTYSTTTLATTTSLWTQGVYFSSSTNAFSVFPYASTTALTVSDSSYLGTVRSGDWQGTTIGIAKGGTNNTTFSTGGLIFYDGSKLTQSAGLSPFYDQSNDRLGVTDTSPDFRFETLGSNGSGYLGVSNNTFGGDGGIFIIDTSGNVGIATSTPGGKLGVQGDMFIAGRIHSTSTEASVFPYASSTAITSSGSAYFGGGGRADGVLISGSATTSLAGTASLPNFFTIFNTGSQANQEAGISIGGYQNNVFHQLVTKLNSGGVTADLIIRNGKGTLAELARFSGASGGFALGTTSAPWNLLISSSSRPQIALHDAGTATDVWTMRNAGGNLYIATSTQAAATSTAAALTIMNSGSGLFVGTTTNSTVTGLAVEGTVVFGSLTQATGGTNNDLCMNGTTNNLVEETTGVCVVSSRKFKHDIHSLGFDALSAVMSLRPVSFSPNDNAPFDYENTQYGFIAEEVADVDPHLAKYGIDGEARTLDDWAILSVVTKAVQDLIAKSIGLEARIDAQDAKILELETRLQEAGI